MANKDELHRLIDALPEALAGELLDFARALRQKELRRSRDAARTALDALPEDDEPVTPGEAAAVAEAKAEPGTNTSAAEARRRLLG
jgi:hypothetical protein